MNECAEMHGWMPECTDVRMHRWVGVWTWRCARMDGWVYGRGGVHIQVNGCTCGLVLGRRERMREEERSDPCGQNLAPGEKICRTHPPKLQLPF